MREWDAVAPQDIVDMILAKRLPTILWGGNYFHVPPSRCWLSWSKVNSVQTMAAMELAWTNLDRPSKELRLPVGTHENGHSTEKPVRLMDFCLGLLLDAHTICDPCCGVGSTGVAAIRLGRAFVGCERVPRYFDIACRRIEAAARQPDLFHAPRAPAPVTERLL